MFDLRELTDADLIKLGAAQWPHDPPASEDIPANTRLWGAGFIARLLAERLDAVQTGLHEVMEKIKAGEICDCDVLWFSEIETLWERLDSLSGGRGDPEHEVNQPPLQSETDMSNAAAAKAIIDSQAAKGLNKYLVPLERSDLSVARLARYGAEEADDLLAYMVEVERRAKDMEAKVEEQAAEIARLHRIIACAPEGAPPPVFRPYTGPTTEQLEAMPGVFDLPRSEAPNA